MEQIEAMADRISAAMAEYVQRSFEAMGRKVAELQAKVDAIPVPKDGKDGADGKDGQGVDQEALAAIIAAAVAAEIAKVPKAKDGEPGAPGKDAAPIDIDATIAYIDATIAAIPAAKDGRDGVDAVSIPGQDGQDGEPGPPGRDALELDVLDGIDETRGYPRGTFAAHKGGLIRATRSTEAVTEGLAKAGWAVIVEGVAEVGVEQGDDLRTFAIGVQTTSGKASVYKFAMPVMIHRGVFKAGTEYVRGDVATWDGSSWHCEAQTKTEPGNGADWKLIAKRGANGKDGQAVKGEPGEPGRAGRDLTQMDLDGRKYS